MTKNEPVPESAATTTYHEAAHAVACYLLWRPFDYVTIVPREETLGHLSQYLPAHPDDQVFEGHYDSLVLDLGVIALAGQVAESPHKSALQTEDASLVGVAPRWDKTFEVMTPDDRALLEAAMRHSSTVVEPQDTHFVYHINKPREAFFNAAIDLFPDNWGMVEALAQA